MLDTDPGPFNCRSFEAAFNLRTGDRTPADLAEEDQARKILIAERFRQWALDQALEAYLETVRLIMCIDYSPDGSPRNKEARP